MAKPDPAICEWGLISQNMPEGGQALLDIHAATRVAHQTDTPLFAG